MLLKENFVVTDRPLETEAWRNRWAIWGSPRATQEVEAGRRVETFCCVSVRKAEQWKQLRTGEVE